MRCPSLNKKQIAKHCGLFLIAILYVLVYSIAGSPLYPVGRTDCNLFKIIGMAILRGELPYVDIFDHKGPLLFYIYALACAIGKGKIGLFIIQTVFTYISFLLQYKIGRLFLPRVGAVVSVAVAFIFMACVNCEGAQSESFEVTFIYIAFYYVLKTFKNKDFDCISRIGMILGACFGCVFLIRMNDGAQIGIIAGMLFIYLIIHGYSGWKFAGYCLVGFIAVCLPFFIYFLSKNMLADVWYGMFTFNLIYAQAKWLHVYFLKFGVMSFIGISLLLIYLTKKNREIFWFVILPCYLAALLFIGNNPFIYYYLVMTPLMGLLATLIYNKYYIILLFWQLIFHGWNIGYKLGTFNADYPFQGSLLTITHDHYKLFGLRSVYKKMHNDMTAMIECVPEAERDQIWNYNVLSYTDLDLFTINNIVPCNRFIQYEHKFYEPLLLELENFERERPKWVVVDHNLLSDSEADYLNENYREIYSYTHDPRTNDDRKISLYKLAVFQ